MRQHDDAGADPAEPAQREVARDQLAQAESGRSRNASNVPVRT